MNLSCKMVRTWSKNKSGQTPLMLAGRRPRGPGVTAGQFNGRSASQAGCETIESSSQRLVTMLAIRFGIVVAYVAVVVMPVFAQLPNPYGTAINLESARKVATAAIAEARKNQWNMAIAIVDPAGELVYFEKLDGTQAASVNIAIDKARSSARFKRPTKALQDVLATGGAGLRMLALDGAVPVEGGVPILMDAKIVGAIGVSGGTSQQDTEVATAAAAAVK